MKTVLGIDIGGTKIAYGLVREDGRAVSRQMPMDREATPDAVMDRLLAGVEQLLAETGMDWESIAGIGMGAPGPLSPRDGRLIKPVNLPAWAGYNLFDKLAVCYRGLMRLENDANCALLGEKAFGAARPYETFAYLTISTGIGGGLYLGGRLVSGRTGNAGEIGHIVVDASQGRCVCGQNGCLEYLASGTAIARRGSERFGRPMRTEDVVAAYRAGDERAIDLLEETFRYIGMGCVALVNLFEPEAIVIGGGVAHVGEPLFTAVSRYVRTHALHKEAGDIPILPARLTADTGVIGAAVLVL